MANEDQVTRVTCDARDGSPDASLRPTVDAISGAKGHTGTSLDFTSLRELGTAGYTPLAQLGAGGMGAVWSARQHSLDRDVALKVAHDCEPETQVALLSEARILGRLEHPHIVPVHDALRDESGAPLLVMRRISGLAWNELLKQPQHPLWDRLLVGARDRLEVNLRILMRVCDAVHFAHGLGVIHRDIKPANVMIGEFGETYLVDWGIATTWGHGADAQAGEVAGTLSFMAPEMIASDATQMAPTTDVYLLGATLHYALTGTGRHVAPTRSALVEAILSSAPVTYGDEVPRELAETANRATARSPADRFQSAEEFRRAIATFLRNRAARTLAHRGDEALLKLRELVLRASPNGGEVERIHNLGIECRLAYRAALDQWEGFSEAQDHLSECIRVLIRYEIQIGNVEGVRGLYAELGEVDPAIELELDELTENRKRRELDFQLGRQAHFDRDFGVVVQARKHFVAILLVTTGTLGVMFVLGRAMTGHDPRPSVSLLAPPVVSLILALISARIMAPQIGRNALGRKLLATIVLAITWILLARIIGNVLGQLPHSATISTELLALLFAIGSASIVLGYALRIGLGIGAVTLLASTLWPSLREHPSVLIAVVLVGLGVEALMWSRRMRAE